MAHWSQLPPAWLGNPSHDDVMKWNHFPAFLALLVGTSAVPVNSPHKGQWRRTDVFFDPCPRKYLSKQWWRWWFETASRSFWRYCNEADVIYSNTRRSDTYYLNFVAISVEVCIGRPPWVLVFLNVVLSEERCRKGFSSYLETTGFLMIKSLSKLLCYCLYHRVYYWRSTIQFVPINVQCGVLITRWISSRILTIDTP